MDAVTMTDAEALAKARKRVVVMALDALNGMSIGRCATAIASGMMN
jgi:hypothetical protein